MTLPVSEIRERRIATQGGDFQEITQLRFPFRLYHTNSNPPCRETILQSPGVGVKEEEPSSSSKISGIWPSLPLYQGGNRGGICPCSTLQSVASRSCNLPVQGHLLDLQPSWHPRGQQQPPSVNSLPELWCYPGPARSPPDPAEGYPNW